jgi:hypothetical protein
MEAVIAISFIALQFGAKCLPLMCSKLAHFALIQRISQHHWIVWLGHPVIWHGLHEYCVHLVVYSGYIISGH